MTPAQWPASSFFPLSYFLSIFQEQTVTRATACVPTGELANNQMDGEPIQIREKEKRGEQGPQRRDVEKDVVLVSLLCHQL